MTKKEYEKQEKRNKAKTILKWVLAGLGWTALLTAFVGLIALGVKGCNNKSNKVEAQAVTTTPLKRQELAPRRVAYPNELASLLGKNYAEGPNYWNSGSDQYIYTIQMANPSQQLGTFEIDYGEEQMSYYISGFTMDNYSLYFKVYSIYGSTISIDYRDMDNARAYNLSLYYFDNTQLPYISVSQAVISYQNNFLAQFNANFEQVGDSTFWEYNYTSALNKDIALIIERTYWQSQIVPSNNNGIWAINPTTSSSQEKIVDNFLANGFFIMDNDNDSDNNRYRRDRLYELLPVYIDYHVYRGTGDIGYGSSSDIDVVVRLSRWTATNSKPYGIYYLDYVACYDNTNNDETILYDSSEEPTLVITSMNDTRNAFEYANLLVNDYEVYFGSTKVVPQDNTIVCYWDNAKVSSAGFKLAPKGYSISGISRIDYTQLTLNIFNNDTFIGQEIIDSNVDSSVSGVFALLKKAFDAIAYFLGFYILPGITIGTLVFIPLVVSIVIFVVWLIKR